MLRRRLSSPALLPPLALLIMAAAWGSTFVLLKDLVRHVPVPDLLALRFSIAAVVMLALAGRRWRLDRRTLGGGVLLGVIYATAQLLQTAGLALTPASVSGFLTGLYVVFTPLLAGLLFRARVSGLTWAAVGLATFGLAVLSLRGFSIGTGELLTVVSAVIYAGHILATDRVSVADRVLGLTVVQMITIAVVCWPFALADGLQVPTSGVDWAVLGYLAVVAGALGIFLQTWAQARVSPTRTAVIMAMEPVWAAVFAVLVGGEPVTPRMVLGGLAVLGAMYLVEIGPWLLARRATRDLQRAGR